MPFLVVPSGPVDRRNAAISLVVEGSTLASRATAPSPRLRLILVGSGVEIGMNRPVCDGVRDRIEWIDRADVLD